MDDDVDFDDLLGEERVVESMTTKRPKVDLSKVPSVNELRLGRRVMELEAERETILTELNELRAKQYTSQSAIPPSDTAPTSAAVTIPHELLPTLDVLRRHIADLSRDNAALRYTFLGQPYASALSPMTAGPSRSGTAHIASPVISSLDQASIVDDHIAANGERVQGVDLEKVIQRVKAVMQENEELGAMVLEAGGQSGMLEEWQKALDESKAVIQSLDSDLTHHLSTIQSLRAELQTAKSASSTSHRPSHTKTPSVALNPASSAWAPPRGLLPAKPREKERTSDSVKTEMLLSPTASQGSVLPGAGSSDRRGGRHRDGDRDRERERDRDRDRDRDSGKEPPKGPRDDRDVKRRR